MKTLGSLLFIVVIAVVGWIGFHAWYVDTHCTMILGTQVCAPLTTDTTTPAAPPVAPSPSSTSGLPAGVSTTPYYGGGFVVDCYVGQCTSLPGAGPAGTNCGPVDPYENVQVCVPGKALTLRQERVYY